MKTIGLQKELDEAHATIRALQQELAETNRGLIALDLELEQRVEQRTAELARANEALRAEIVERRRMEEDRERLLSERKQQSQFLASLIENAPIGVAVVDWEMRLVLANPAYCAIAGAADTLVAGRTIAEVFSPAVAAIIRAAVRPVFDTGRPAEFRDYEAPVRGRTWWNVSEIPLHDAAGNVEAVLILTQEVTEQKLAEMELEAAKNAAEAANEAKGRFLANISHELRTPMNAILGMVDLALPRVTDPTARDLLKTVKESADLLLALLNDLLDSAKIESGKLELEDAPFSLRGVLDQTTRVLAVKAHEKGIDFSCRVPPEVPDALIGDQVRLRQVLYNLANNAIKFTERGEVAIEVMLEQGAGSTEQRAESRGAEEHGPASTVDRQPSTVDLHFAVRDTGIGISAADQERIFHPFAQADASTTRRFGGTGLGLTICASLVELMGGRIWVESELGRGSTFHFTARLPLADELPSAPETEPDLSTPPAAPLRVLLVEDNPANQKLAAHILRERGHAVAIAGDGRSGVRLAQEDRFDVVLMDVQMPGMDGLEATQAIRAREKGPRPVPIIAMTAHAMKGDRERCLAAGMNGYLSKPISPREMLALVENLAAGSSPAASPPFPQTTASPPAAEVFDRPLALHRCLNDEEMLREMAASFLCETTDLFPRIRAALEEGDLREVGRLGHRLKGTIVYLAAEPAKEAALRVEHFERHEGDRSEAEEAVKALERQCNLLKAALAREGLLPGATEAE